jgi:hypothetical protein
MPRRRQAQETQTEEDRAEAHETVEVERAAANCVDERARYQKERWGRG